MKGCYRIWVRGGTGCPGRYKNREKRKTWRTCCRVCFEDPQNKMFILKSYIIVPFLNSWLFSYLLDTVTFNYHVSFTRNMVTRKSKLSKSLISDKWTNYVAKSLYINLASLFLNTSCFTYFTYHNVFYLRWYCSYCLCSGSNVPGSVLRTLHTSFFLIHTPTPWRNLQWDYCYYIL